MGLSWPIDESNEVPEADGHGRFRSNGGVDGPPNQAPCGSRMPERAGVGEGVGLVRLIDGSRNRLGGKG